VSLPGYIGQEREDEETPDDGYPEGKGEGDGEDKNPQFRSHYCQCTAQGKDRPGGADHYGCGSPQEQVQNAAQYPAAEIDQQEPALTHQAGKV